MYSLEQATGNQPEGDRRTTLCQRSDRLKKNIDAELRGIVAAHHTEIEDVAKKINSLSLHIKERFEYYSAPGHVDEESRGEHNEDTPVECSQEAARASFCIYLSRLEISWNSQMWDTFFILRASMVLQSWQFGISGTVLVTSCRLMRIIWQ